MKITLNKNKRIGKVIYIVEGDVTESDIIIKVFKDMLGYNIIKYDKRNDEYTMLISSNDKYSKVYIIPSKYSAINKVFEIDEYLLNIYKKLAIDYELDVENNAIFYLYDRDRYSNRPTPINAALEKLGNSRDNDEYEMNGLMLLSYPSIEAFYLNCYKDDTRLTGGKDAKELAKKYSNLVSCESSLIEGTFVALQKVCNITNIDTFDANCLSKFKEVNKKIFNYEEKEYHQTKTYDALSLLFMSLIDLGILEINN